MYTIKLKSSLLGLELSTIHGSYCFLGTKSFVNQYKVLGDINYNSAIGQCCITLVPIVS